MNKIKYRLVRTGDGYVRESIELCHSWKEAFYLRKEHELSDPTGFYEIVRFRKRSDEK